MKTIMGREVLDTLPELVDPRWTAVLAIDIQNDFCDPKGHFARYGKNVGIMAPAVVRMVEFINEAQALGMRTIFMRQLSLSDARMDSPAWLRFKTRDGKAPDYTLPGSWGAGFVDGLTVRHSDWVVEKFRPDSFIGTHLDHILRTQGIMSAQELTNVRTLADRMILIEDAMANRVAIENFITGADAVTELALRVVGSEIGKQIGRAHV